MKARAVGSLFLGLALAFNAHQRIESAERSASETGLVAGAQQRPDAFIPGVPTIVGIAMRFTLAALFFVGVFVSPLAAQAQGTSRYDIAGGYSYLHDQDISENLSKGWVVSVGGRVMKWLDAVGEVGGNHKTLSIPGDPPKIRVLALMGSPRLTGPGYRRLTPFGQVLFGAAWARTSVLDVGDSVRDFAYQPGAGVNWNLGPRVGIRLEGDYRIIRAEGSNSKEPRFVAAAVFGLGR